jgi:hypothetical protein
MVGDGPGPMAASVSIANICSVDRRKEVQKCKVMLGLVFDSSLVENICRRITLHVLHRCKKKGWRRLEEFQVKGCSKELGTASTTVKKSIG